MIYVTNKVEYRERTREVGERYRKHMGNTFRRWCWSRSRVWSTTRRKLRSKGSRCYRHEATNSPFFTNKTMHGIATITFNRPERLNALTFEVYRELTDTFAALRDERDVRVVVITGAGRAFCSGGDVHDIIGELFSRNMEGLLEFTRMTCELVQNIRALPKPVIASLNGTTAGRRRVHRSRFRHSHRQRRREDRVPVCEGRTVGPDMGAAYLLPRVVGLAKATEMLYTGDFISAAEAERIGLYNRVVPAAELATATRDFAQRLARGPAFALGKTKRCSIASWT